MSAYVEQMRETFRSLDGEELIDRVKTGSLTDEAHAVAVAELAARGMATTDLPAASVASEESSKPGFLARCFSGKEELWRAYWLLGLVGGVLSVPLRLFSSAGSVGGALLLLVLINLPFQVFWSIAVWRCAFRTSHWVWAVAARSMVVVLAIYIIASWWPVAMLLLR